MLAHGQLSAAGGGHVSAQSVLSIDAVGAALVFQNCYGQAILVRQIGRNIVQLSLDLGHQRLGPVLHVKDHAQGQNVLTLVGHGLLVGTGTAAAAAVQRHIGAHAALVPEVHIAQAFVGEGGVPGGDEVGLQGQQILLAQHACVLVVINFCKLVGQLGGNLTVHSAGGHDAVGQPQRQQNLNIVLGVGVYPLRGLFKGILYRLFVVVIGGDGEGILGALGPLFIDRGCAAGLYQVFRGGGGVGGVRRGTGGAGRQGRGQRQGHQGRQGFLSNMHNWALLSVFRVRYVLAALEHKQPAFHRKQAAEAAHGM